MLENQDNAPVITAGENNVPVATPPLVNASLEAVTQAQQSGNEPNAPVANVPVVIQAGLGRLICEYCGADVPRRTYNQRFCCTPCRMAFHGYKKAAESEKMRYD
ncbi:hypothetical protein EPO05_06505 [Patescibacteria group bacterium]|nr:MAG: hypothetical protein EPO05_06505 [Patescibacteria group bacterium]